MQGPCLREMLRINSWMPSLHGYECLNILCEWGNVNVNITILSEITMYYCTSDSLRGVCVTMKLSLQYLSTFLSRKNPMHDGFAFCNYFSVYQKFTQLLGNPTSPHSYPEIPVEGTVLSHFEFDIFSERVWYTLS